MNVTPSDLIELIGPDFVEEEITYVRFHAKRFCFLLDIVEELVERKSQGVRPVKVLDVGPSFFTRCMKQFMGDRIELDTLGWSHERVAPAKLIHKHWPFDLNDAQRRSQWTPVDQQDIVVMAEVIEHLHTAPSLVLGFVRTLLKVGGNLVLQTPNAVSIDKRVRLLTGSNPYECIRENTRNPGHFREYTARELLEFTGMNGLDCIRMQKESYWACGPIQALLERVYPNFRTGLTAVCKKMERPDLDRESLP